MANSKLSGKFYEGNGEDRGDPEVGRIFGRKKLGDTKMIAVASW